MECPRCHAQNRDGLKFCEDCGARLSVTCSQCGAEITRGKRFCGSCGAPVADHTANRCAAPEAYTPEHLAEKILTSKSALEGERKQVTVLFDAGAGEVVLPAKVTRPIRRGDVFLPGAGGWGDLLTRDPALVLRDVRNGLVGLAGARDDYGVVVDATTWTVDGAATEARRAELARVRGWATVPRVSR